MPEEFSYAELSIIRNMMLSRSHKDIASVLDRPVDEITSLIADLKPMGVETHQEKLDANKAALKERKPKALKPVVANQPAVRKKIVSKAAVEKKLRDQRKEEKKNNQIERMNVEAQRKAKNKLAEQKYATKAIDYSKKVLIKIDRFTHIYSERGKEKETKAAFLKHYKRPIDQDFNPPKVK